MTSTEWRASSTVRERRTTSRTELAKASRTRRAFERIFREFGLPRAILSDNGSPFGSPGLARLSRLSLWWIRLGIAVERIVPGHPEQNGAHERMHRTLKAETARPPDSTPERQQKRFDDFRYVYNHERPHEALGQKRPATIYRPSLRPYPESLPPIEYASHLEKRKIEHNGMMRWKNGRIFTSKTCAASTSASKRSTTAPGRCTTARCCWPVSTNGR